MWPANMLPKSRSASVTGRVNRSVISSRRKIGEDHALGQARRHERLPVADEAVLLHADDVEDDPDDEGQRDREADAAHRRVAHRRDDAEEVVGEDEHEHREEQRDEPHELLRADEVLGDAVADQAVDGLGAHLATARDEGLLARRGEQPPGDQDERERHQQHRAGDRPGAVGPEEGLPELLDAGGGVVRRGGGHDAHGLLLRRFWALRVTLCVGGAGSSPGVMFPAGSQVGVLAGSALVVSAGAAGLNGYRIGTRSGRATGPSHPRSRLRRATTYPASGRQGHPGRRRRADPTAGMRRHATRSPARGC